MLGRGQVKWQGADNVGRGKAEPGDPAQQLYNLKDDSYQKNGRIVDYPERAVAMAELLNKKLKIKENMNGELP